MLREDIEKVLNALGEQLDSLAQEPIELLVCGGSALNVLGFIKRATKDVDVLAYVNRNKKGEKTFIKADPLRPVLLEASKKVARDFNLPENWLNAGPASAVDLGLPEGIMERVITRRFGKKLIVHFLGRYDQIHFKLYAAADQGAGKHFDDLLALKPGTEELEKAARWSMTHDISEGYRQSLKKVLSYMGYEDVAERL
ncbi:MAG: DUF6036 family nucleotidyltransferase [Thermodesulfobacteriota bacterium]|nr:DUF6036 family nucleotidyltransferase [Thermodesulfobacteriota bacterium]